MLEGSDNFVSDFPAGHGMCYLYFCLRSSQIISCFILPLGMPSLGSFRAVMDIVVDLARTAYFFFFCWGAATHSCVGSKELDLLLPTAFDEVEGNSLFRTLTLTPLDWPIAL